MRMGRQDTAKIWPSAATIRPRHGAAGLRHGRPVRGANGLGRGELRYKILSWLGGGRWYRDTL